MQRKPLGSADLGLLINKSLSVYKNLRKAQEKNYNDGICILLVMSSPIFV